MSLEYGQNHIFELSSFVSRICAQQYLLNKIRNDLAALWELSKV